MKQKIIYFNSRDKLLRIDVDNIAYFEGDGNYTNIIMTNKLKSCLSVNLSQMEHILGEQFGDAAGMFMRIGKRFIVNMRYIYQVDIQKQQLIVSDFDNFTYLLPVSKEALRSVKKLIINAKI